MEYIFIAFMLLLVLAMIMQNARKSRKKSTISQTAVVNGQNNTIRMSASSTVSRPASRPVSSGYVAPGPSSSYTARRDDDSADPTFAAAYVASSYYNDSYSSSSSCDSGSSSYDSSSSSSYDSGSSSSCGD